MAGEIYDLAIIGAGPAGLSAAVNAKARNLKAIVIESRHVVSKVRTYPIVTNYLGFARVSGSELAKHFDDHFAHTGYQLVKELVMKIVPSDGMLMISTDQGIYQTKTVAITTGVAQTKTLPGEDQFLGRGVSYCVTCDGALYRGKDVVVVGYIPEGEEEANALAGFGRNVTYVATYEEVKSLEPGVNVVHARPVAIKGDSRARALETDMLEIPAEGIFIIRKAVPVGTLLDGLRMRGDYIDVGCDMATSVPGVFAGGDCAGPPFQIAKAVGQGQVAALSAARYAHEK